MASRRTTLGPSSIGGPSASNSHFTIGQRVEAQGGTGTVRFTGLTEFAPGPWVGIELDIPEGKNDGFVKGKRYFNCQPNHGIFVKPQHVRPMGSRPGSSMSSGSHGISTPSRSLNTATATAGGRQHLPIPPSSGLNDRRKTTIGTQLGGPGSARGIGTPSRIVGKAPGPGSRRLSNVVPGSTRVRSGSQSGMKSPTLGRRDSIASGTTSPTMRPSELRPSLHESQSLRARAGTPTSDSVGNLERTEEYDGEDADGRGSKTPTSAVKKDSAQPEIPSTPYRPALSLNESAAYESVKSAAPMSDQTVSLKSYEELRLKFKYLEQKRSEDRQRIQDADRIRSEAEQALRIREKLAAKIASLQDELRKAKQQLKEKEDENNELENKYADTVETLEMLTIDKEMVEEKSEDMTQEIARLKEQLAEATTSLDVYKSDADLMPVSSGEPGAMSSMDILQIQKQNERLKEALVKLRDLTSDNEVQLNARIKELTKEAGSAQSLQDQISLLKGKLDASDNQIEDLKQRLDEALGAEEMIEELSERNLNLSEQIEKMNAQIDELEALREVNDEMEENHIETEKQLQTEIEYKDIVIKDQSQKIESLEESLADYQNTIAQFRELVSNLQADIQKLQRKEKDHETEAETLSSQSQAMMSLNMQLQASALKTKAKTIDLELRKLEASQATKQLKILELFTPSLFFKTENDPLRTLFLFERLSCKARIICGQLEQDESSDSSITDDFVNSAEARYRLTELQGLSDKFAAYLSTCSPQEFAKLGFIYHDITGIERRLNGHIDLLRGEEFRPVDCIADVEKSSAHIETLIASYIPQKTTFTQEATLRSTTDCLAHCADVAISNLAYSSQLLSFPREESEEKILSQDIKKDISEEITPRIDIAIQQCKAYKVVAVKLLRKIADLKNQSMSLIPSVMEKIVQCTTVSKALLKYSILARKDTQDYIRECTEAESGLEISRLQELFSSATEEVFDSKDAVLLGTFIDKMKELTSEVSGTLDSFSDQVNVEKSPSSEQPWAKRAEDFKANLVQNTEVESRMESLNEEIISLARELKLKEKDNQEANVKIEILEKRSEMLGKQSKQLDELRAQLSKAKTQEAIFEEAIDNLQSELENLERENKRLKRSGGLDAFGQREFDDDNGSANVPSGYAVLLQRRIMALQGALQFTRKENANLRAQIFERSSSSISAAMKHHLESAGINKNTISFALSSTTSEARKLIKEAYLVAGAPKLIRLGDSSESSNASSENKPENTAKPSQKAMAWEPLSQKPRYEFYRQQTLVRSLHNRVSETCEQIQKLTMFPSLVRLQSSMHRSVTSGPADSITKSIPVPL
ncbi:hypothetical protein H4219_001038 [Mycoemilia scoparia]|uniref:CAP-Gly domain-containing protein n=1 Tax=Mycoemilia scoparia TaxID=417184 RepID=A0A9W8A1E2_9FUNG|nr:hypothetical protein H4219_001038 [Mycoemilia scoparia]